MDVIAKTSHLEEKGMVSLFDLARNDKLVESGFANMLPDVEVMEDGGVFIKRTKTTYDHNTGVYYKSIFLVLDHMYKLVVGFEEPFVKIIPAYNLLKVTKCLSTNGEFDIEYLINVNNATYITNYELLKDPEGNPMRVKKSLLDSEEYRNKQEIINMVGSLHDVNGNGISNEFIRKIVRDN